MKFKSCLTCKYFRGERNLLGDTRDTVILNNPLCMHDMSDGRTTEEMTYRGACGRDRRLWIRKEKKYSEIEIMETD